MSDFDASIGKEKRHDRQSERAECERRQQAQHAAGHDSRGSKQAALQSVNMPKLIDLPAVVLAIAFLLQVIAAYCGDYIRRRTRQSDADPANDYKTILPSALTLLALIVGFAFSMAVSRYDQRKSYEEEEANAIGTEYVRADILPPAESAHIHDLLIKYTELRIQFYEIRDQSQLDQIAASTSDLQTALWASVVGPTTAQPTPPMALLFSGMNDVLNSQGYTQAAFWNRVPIGAWLLMMFVAMACNFLIGFTEQRRRQGSLLVLPFILAIPFLLIADIDSPHGGLIRVVPQNLIALAHSLSPR